LQLVLQLLHVEKAQQRLTGQIGPLPHAGLEQLQFIPHLHDQVGSTSWLYVSWTSQCDVCSMFARSCKRGIKPV